jgi:hypothetical protein
VSRALLQTSLDEADMHDDLAGIDAAQLVPQLAQLLSFYLNKYHPSSSSSCHCCCLALLFITSRLCAPLFRYPHLGVACGRYWTCRSLAKHEQQQGGGDVHAAPSVELSRYFYP